MLDWLYFLIGILCFFNVVPCTAFFRTETSPSVKVIVVHMKGFPFAQEIKQYHTQTYSFTMTECALKAISQRNATHF